MSDVPDPFRILFVCLGNICRSPLAEGVFLHLADEAGLSHRLEVDSAGTGAYHVGERPDRRSIEVASRHGIELPGRARQAEPEDFERFHMVVAMDRSNHDDLAAMAPGDATAELRMLREFDPEADGDLDVPDPYYGGPQGFDRVYEMVRRSCETLLDELSRELD
jgi:protein-tyrosine phosphatase